VFFKDRSKRIAKIATSAAPHLEPDEEVVELVQVQSGRSADANWLAVYNAYEEGRVNVAAEGAVVSFAVIATERNLYLATLTGARLLDVDAVVHKEPLADADVTIADEHVSINGTELHVMNHFGPHVAHMRDLIAAAKSG
jgi:hypothetical protein